MKHTIAAPIPLKKTTLNSNYETGSIVQKNAVSCSGKQNRRAETKPTQEIESLVIFTTFVSHAVDSSQL